MHWFVVLIILAISLGIFLMGYVRHRLLTALPTSRLGSVTAGYRELHGVAQASPCGVLLDPIQNRQCVWFRVETYRQEERVRRDHRSGRETVTRVWEKIDEAESSRPFVLDDGSGQCVVAPAGAKIEVPAERVTVGGGLFGGGLRHEISRIQAGERVFAIGQLSATGDSTFCLEKPRDGSTFLITKRTEQQMLRGTKYQQIASGAVAIICSLALLSELLTQSPDDMRAALAEARASAAAPTADAAAPAPIVRDALLVERPKVLSEAERETLHRRQRWIDQLRARQAYAGLDTAPPMLGVTDEGASVIVANRADRELTLHLSRLPNPMDAQPRLCMLQANGSAADGATVLKPKEKVTFNSPPDCSTRGSLDYRVGSHADLDSDAIIGWWSMSAIEREAAEIRRMVGR